MTTTERAPSNGARPLEGRPTGELLASISTDVVTLVRQEVELAKLEVTEALAARMVAMAVGAVAGVFAILLLVFLGLAASQALTYVIPSWAARLVVASAFGAVVLMALPLALRLLRKPELRPAETMRTTKEDIEWAKAQLKR
jgi:uncharacterized membrane protein YqjE